MCSTCGCGADEARVTSVDLVERSSPKARRPAPEHPHEHTHPQRHEHEDDHVHDHALAATETISLEQRILAKNDHLAAHNREWLIKRRITAINLMSSPGAGKTTLLERTINESRRRISVIEGDQETIFDAARIRAAGARAVQINTGAGCHLDATMVQRALDELNPADNEIVFVENVGNLVCPALFDLGESRRVVIISVTEGDDKPLKYPHMFAAADLVIVNKTDLLPYVDFDLGRLSRDARKLNHAVEVLPLSARSGENMRTWHDWLDRI